MKNLVKSIIFLVVFVIVTSFVFADWEVPETGTVGQVNSILENGGAIFAGTSSGVYISINSGKQWIERNGEITNKDIQSIVSIGSSVYAGSNGGGVYKTTNLGEKWTTQNDGLGNPFVYALAVDGDSLYAVTDESGVFMSKDRGETWFSLNNGDIIGIVLFSIAVKDGKVYVGGQYGNIYTTTDYGLTWENINKGDLFFDIKSIKFEGDKMLVGTSSGIFYSTDLGVTWKVINSGLKNTNVSQVAFNGDYFYAATMGGGVFISDNEGASWISVNEGIPGMNVSAIGFNDQYVFAGFQFNPVSRRLLSEIKVPVVEPPVLSSPENGQEHVDPEVTFTWKESTGAMSYNIQVALSNDFSNPIFQKDNIKTTSLKQTLERGLTYYWHVAANTADEQKKWSEVWTFTTREEQTAPDLVYPQDNATEIPIPVTFVWTSTKGTFAYNIQISADENFENLIVNKQIQNDTTYTYDNLDEHTLYYWRVYSIGYDDKKMNKSTYSFTSGKTSDVSEYIDNENGMVSLYPNPVKETLNLKFNFSSSNVTIEIYSMKGVKFDDVYRGNVSVGTVINLDKIVTNLTNGMYLIEISDNGKSYIVPFIKN